MKSNRTMTDEEIHSEWVLTTMGTGTLKTDLMALIKFARAEGIAQGKCNGCICKSMAERAVADTEIYDKGLKAGFDIGWKESEISLKTKLISDEVCIAIEESGGSFYDAKGIRKLLSVALAEVMKNEIYKPNRTKFRRRRNQGSK